MLPVPEKQEPAPVAVRPRQRLPLTAALLGCGALLLVSMILGVAIGSVPLSPATVLSVIGNHLAGHGSYSVADAIVWDIRLPRVLLAAVVGATLTTAGTVVQVLVRNALAARSCSACPPAPASARPPCCCSGPSRRSASGPSRSAACWGRSGPWRRSSSSRARAARYRPPSSSCAASSFPLFESVTSFLIFRGNPHATQAVLFWLLGSFGLATWPQLPIPAIVLAIAIGYLLTLGRPLNALAVGTEPAAALGVDVQALRRNLFIVTSLMAGVAVAVSGVIGFVGLLARVIVAPQEMPIGVITAFIGAPVLIVLIRRSSNLSRRSASRSWPRSTTSAWPRCSATPCT